MRLTTLLTSIALSLLPFSIIAQTQPASLSHRLTETPKNSFEYGALQALFAIEQLLQDQVRHQLLGISLAVDPEQSDTFGSITTGADKLTETLTRFDRNLEAARSTLQSIPAEEVEPFVWDVTALFLDISGDGKPQPGEKLSNLIVQRGNLSAAMPEQDAAPLEVRFDRADVSWLVAYTHALSGLVNGVLAFDPTPVLQDLRQAKADLADIPALEGWEKTQGSGTVGSLQGILTEYEIDSIYLVIKALKQHPDPQKIANMRDHWALMLAANKVFWADLGMETDNDREWVPNPQQSNAFGITVSAEMAVAWQDILGDAQAVLEGRLLLPSWSTSDDIGLNLATWMENPSSLELISWFHGRASYPYLAYGPVISDQSLREFDKLTGGQAGIFTLFLN